MVCCGKVRQGEVGRGKGSKHGNPVFTRDDLLVLMRVVNQAWIGMVRYWCGEAWVGGVRSGPVGFGKVR